MRLWLNKHYQLSIPTSHLYKYNDLVHIAQSKIIVRHTFQVQDFDCSRWRKYEIFRYKYPNYGSAKINFLCRCEDMAWMDKWACELVPWVQYPALWILNGHWPLRLCQVIMKKYTCPVNEHLLYFGFSGPK